MPRIRLGFLHHGVGCELAAPGLAAHLLGGHEIRQVGLADEAVSFQQSSRAFGETLIQSVTEDLREADTRIRPGLLHRSGSAIEQLAPDIAGDDRPAIAKVEQIRQDLQDFQADND